MKSLIIILIVLFFSDLMWKPRLDFTREGNLLLWYGKTTRKHIKLL